MNRRAQQALLFVAFVAVALLGAQPASAQYEPGQPGFVLDPPVAAPGAVLDIFGTGCPAGSLVEVSIADEVVATTTAAADGLGSFSATVTAPDRAGQYVVTVTCGGVTMNQVLTVAASECGFAVTGAPGAPVTATAPGLEPGTGYTLLFETPGAGAVQVGSGTTASDPQTVNFTIPSGTPAGSHNLVIAGTAAAGGDAVITCAVTVTGGVTGALPRTGADTGALARYGAVLLGAGALVLLAVRRRTAHA